MTTLELGHEQQAVPTERHLVAGRYRLHAKIGRGRLGDIYEADDEGYRELGVGGRVALQLLPDRIALDQGLFSKLKLGYTVLRAGPHPNLVSYLDCDYDGKFGYVVMELLDGASLRLVLDDVSNLPLDEALPVIRAIGDALQFLHAKSMVHGRVSAENVFVVRGGVVVTPPVSEDILKISRSLVKSEGSPEGASEKEPERKLFGRR